MRPALGATRVRLEVRHRSTGRWRALKALGTSRRGTWATRTVRRSDRRYRVLWTDADGVTQAGPPTRVRRLR